MGAMKRWMHDVHDDCLSMGVRMEKLKKEKL